MYTLQMFLFWLYLYSITKLSKKLKNYISSSNINNTLILQMNFILELKYKLNNIRLIFVHIFFL